LEATQATLTAAEGETSAAWAMLSDADGSIIGKVILSEKNFLSTKIPFPNNHLFFLHGKPWSHKFRPSTERRMALAPW